LPAALVYSGLLPDVVDEDDRVPDAHPDEDVAAENPVQLDDPPVVEGQGGELVRPGGQDERSRAQVEATVVLHEVAARQQTVRQLLHGALGGVERSRELRQRHALRGERHRLEDRRHPVDGAVRTGWHAMTAPSTVGNFPLAFLRPSL
jgi:hypothetical protein